LSYLYLKADIYPDLSKREEVEAAYRELIEASLEEPGCLLYDLVIDDANPGVWHMFEKWQSREIWDAHMASPHVAKIQSIEDGLTVKATVLNFYDSVLAKVSH
jgi:quinol monooxygenase YgiN